MAPITAPQAAAAALVWVGGTVALHFLKPLPWSLAAIAGLAMAILAAQALRTLDRLRRIWRHEPPRAD